MSLCSFIYLIVVIIQRIFTDTAIAGWASTVAIVLFSQGIVLMMLGIIGEYIGRTFDEIKGRPVYIVREIINGEDENIGNKNSNTF
jgi:dolichol-phosphate mannosyltransferase